ncbi:hypothetical protein [Aeromonas hydrophila]|uniref:hypothetical protein n=1 Tax=Aeromonas hydrophila TaxID=644 RepID=UPI0030189671
MINAVIAIELEAYLKHYGQIEVVHEQRQPVDGGGHSRIRQFIVGSTTTGILKTAKTSMLLLR